MSDLVLVNPPLRRYDVADTAPPLGLLLLAWYARYKRDLEVEILDMNLPPWLTIADDPASFYETAVAEILNRNPREVGITSMGVNSHLALELASRLRGKGVEVVLGGVHLASIFRELRDNLGFEGIVTPEWQREATGRWWSVEPSMLGSESAPSPAELFSSVNLGRYFEIGHGRVANFSVGSGCKYRCEFCYSPGFHGAPSRLVASDAAKRIADLGDLGFGEVFLVEDNLFNDRKWFEELCEELRGQDRRLPWYGYATLPELTPRRLDLAASAGCIGLYVGVDTVERSQQREWNKPFVRSFEQVASVVRHARDSGMRLTTAFILDLRDGSRDALDLSVDYAMRLAFLGADIRFSVISLYPGTGLAQRHGGGSLEYSEDKACMLMDLPTVVVENSLARRFPALFPWHSRPSDVDRWSTGILAVAVAQAVLNFELEAVREAGLQGGTFWEVCCKTAQRLEGSDVSIHKTELQGHLRREAASVMAGEPF